MAGGIARGGFRVSTTGIANAGRQAAGRIRGQTFIIRFAGTESGDAVATKLIIDADPGIGDALAVTAALLDPEVDLIALTGVAGRVSGQQATRNLQAVVALLDPPKWPRIGRGEGGPAITPADDRPDPVLLNGEGGLGEFQAYDAEPADRTESDKLLADLVRANPNEVTLLTLGPLTNLHRATGRDPQFLELVGEVVCLGGAVACGGDVTAAAEFNIFADAEAARHVLRSRSTVTMLPLDVSDGVTLTLDQFDRLNADPNTRLGRLLGLLLPYYFRAHHQYLGQESVCVGELAALAAVTARRLFSRERMRVDVETSGELTAGATVFDRRGVAHHETNVDVFDEADTQGVIDHFARLAADSRSRGGGGLEW